eukprot:TRINITY_DN10467_c0_g1_i2.p1 TRINITY_DN10467_c0_g1~~TRINITY_DN10467_c0_g1_i2.p1  ORF type:complete len:569 (+),score=112.05 TRINITY_DN10467_c0_g1_i2:102-1808(+)
MPSLVGSEMCIRDRYQYEDEFWNLVRYTLNESTQNTSDQTFGQQQLYFNQLNQNYTQQKKQMSIIFEQSGSGQISQGTDPQQNYDTPQNNQDDDMLSGQIKINCENLIKKGEWDKAIAYAPSVSFEYWQDLSKQYAVHLSKINPEEAAYYYMLSGEFQKCSIDFVKISNLEEVQYIMYQIQEKRKLIQEKSNSNKNENCLPIIQNGKQQILEKLRFVTKFASENAAKEGQPILAALAHLIKYDIDGAIIKLLRMNQVIYAYLLAKLFNSELQGITKNKILQRAIRYKNLKIINDIATTSQKIMIKALYFGEKYQPSDIANLTDVSQYQRDILSTVVDLNLDKACLILINTAKAIIQDKKVELFDKLIEQLKLFRYYNLGYYNNLSLKKQVLFIYRYLGFKKACWKGLTWIIYPLYQSLKQLIQDQDVETLLTPEFSELYIDIEFYSVIMYFNPDQAILKLNELLKNVSIIRQNQIKKIIKNAEILKKMNLSSIQEELNKNRMYEEKYALPISQKLYQIRYSSFSQQPIRCDGYIFEDKKTMITLNEALMWQQCDPYSYLNTGILVDCI